MLPQADDRCRHDADLGLGISRYRRPRAARNSRVSARVTQSFFFTSIYRRVYRSILLEKYTSPAILRNRRGWNKIPAARRGKVRFDGRARSILYTVKSRLSLGLDCKEKYLLQYLTSCRSVVLKINISVDILCGGKKHDVTYVPIFTNRNHAF